MATKLPTQPLGKNGPQIPALGFGTMGLSSESFLQYARYSAHILNQHSMASCHPMESASSFWTAFTSSAACTGTLLSSMVIARCYLENGSSGQARGRMYYINLITRAVTTANET